MSERTDPAMPAPEPNLDRPGEPDWGPTPVPIQEPAAEPRGARTGALAILGVVVIIAIVALVWALVR
ncbi:hypothetical protein OG552_04200 [Streptomyces sp. NBC_01476]|uniref:hypothetical protein n=1 Tax=Streptomyces sp. NBC_01476 TaxID=2903881 RepID=UPI002E37EBD9|nr:hypothetical protein [Streptomyces sp. NBC_01476]